MAASLRSTSGISTAQDWVAVTFVDDRAQRDKVSASRAAALQGALRRGSSSWSDGTAGVPDIELSSSGASTSASTSR